VTELDKHLATLFVLFHQCQKHHWLVEGPQFRDIHHFLEEGYTEIHKQLRLHAHDPAAQRGSRRSTRSNCVAAMSRPSG